MELKIEKVPLMEKKTLENLYSLYLHDLAEFTDDLEVSSAGSYVYDSIDMLWTNEGIEPHFIKDSEKLVGFLLLLKRPFLKNDHDICINDFFILKNYRRKGIGKRALTQLFRENKGKYVIMELAQNQPAVTFWRKALSQLGLEYTEEKKMVEEEECYVQTFEVFH